jgi:hypothetical protein
MARRRRMTRKAPVRVAPIRNAMTGAPADDARSNGARFTLGAVVDQGLRAAQQLTETADATVKGAVERGVETAYMVIEEYMLRGQEAASQYRQRTERPHMNDEQQRFNAWNAPGPMGPLMAPWMSWMQLMRLWADAMAAFGAGGGPAADFWMRLMSGSSGGLRPKTAVEVSSESPTELMVAVDLGAECSKLTAEPLGHATDKDVPPLAGVSIETSPEVIRVRLSVPNDQPGGQYRGALKDERGMKRGELVATVKPPAAVPRPAPRPRARARKK